jgi:hypothetical protein
MHAADRRRRGELAAVVAIFAALAVLFTWPLAFRIGSVGRADNGDGQFAIWNVAWVARTLAIDPLHVFDANIFYPNRGTLAYSEANIGAGLVAMPVYWLTRNPYAAYNFVLLLSFVASGAGTFCLVRYLFQDRRAALIAAIAFAFCPYLFGHIPHVQLLMTAGLPWTMLAFHRFADRPSAARGAVLGVALAAQAVFCAYYGIFAILMVGLAIAFTSIVHRRYADPSFWKGLALGALVAAALVAPVAMPYLTFQRETGFERSLDAAREYAARWQMYLASNAYAHSWMMRFAGRSGELLFPGFVALAFGLVGLAALRGADRRWRDLAILYASVAGLAFWISLGPAGGLYTALYHTVPGITFLRAPSRVGVVVVFAAAVLAGLGIAKVLARLRRPAVAATAIAVVTVAELIVPLRLTPAPPVAPAYRVLATLPPGALLELPVYSHQFRFLRARYMLSSTAHWMPLVVAYSDYIPASFARSMNDLAGFPSRAAFDQLERDGVRYVLFHLDQFGEARHGLGGRLKEFQHLLRPLHADEQNLLFEIVAYR